MVNKILKCISLKENFRSLIKIMRKFVSKDPIENKSTLVQGTKQSSEVCTIEVWEWTSNFIPYFTGWYLLLLIHIKTLVTYRILWSYLSGVATAMGTHEKIWTWLKGSYLCLFKINIFPNGEINEQNFSNPHPWSSHADWSPDNWWCLTINSHNTDLARLDIIILTPASMKLKGGILHGFMSSVHPSVCLSVCLWTKLCPFCNFHNTSRIHFIFTHLIKQFPKVCRIWSILQNSKLWIFGKFCNLQLWLCLVLTWDLMWITSMGHHGVAGVSEHRHSTSSFHIPFTIMDSIYIILYI